MNCGIWTREQVVNGDNHRIRFDYTDLVAILASPGVTQPEAQNLLLDHLDERFLFGAMSAGLSAEILAAYTALSGGSIPPRTVRKAE